MRVGLLNDPPVCLTCRLRLNRLLHPLIGPYRLHAQSFNQRPQSTATATSEDPIEPHHSSEDVQSDHWNPRKPKRRWRRIWRLPPVAELGVSSLGKPAEVLVLGHRDRDLERNRVQDQQNGAQRAVENGNDKFSPSKPQIIEALQAESLPMSSENVKQTLDQIGDLYRSRSNEVSTAVRDQLKKRIIRGFTQAQLSSYYVGGNQFDPHITASTPSNSREVPNSKTPQSPGRARDHLEDDTVGVQADSKLGKAALVDRIMQNRWSLFDPEEVESISHLVVPSRKLNFICDHKQSSFNEHSRRFQVEIDILLKTQSIRIKGKRKNILLAKAALKTLCDDIKTIHVRSMLSYKDLKTMATPAWLSRLTKTYQVVVDRPTSKQLARQPNDDECLSICFHQHDDWSKALNAQRAILFAEREFLRARALSQPDQKTSIWFLDAGIEPDLRLHHTTAESKGLVGNERWSRWVIPQKPVQLACRDPWPDSPSTMQEYLASISRQCTILLNILTGELDGFFSPLQAKMHPSFRRLANEYGIKDELAVHFGKILFSHGKMSISDAFPHRHERFNNKTSIGHFLSTGVSSPTTLSVENLGIPKFLNSLPPFQDQSLQDIQDKHQQRHYYLRYVPAPSKRFDRSQAPTIEISISRTFVPGAAVRNRVYSVWAIMAEQSHKLLLPGFALDLNFTRRLKSRLCKVGAQPSSEPPWLQSFQAEIRDLDSDQFPPALDVILPYPMNKDLRMPLALQRSVEKRRAEASSEGTTSQPPANPKSTKQSRHEFNWGPVEMSYMLARCERVHSNISHKIKSLCLEQFCLESVDGDYAREFLRLAPKSVLDPDEGQAGMAELLKRSFKAAAQLSNPCPFSQHEDDGSNETGVKSTDCPY